MSEAEIIHDAEVIGTEVVPAAPPPSLFRTDEPVEILRRATETAEALAGAVRAQKLTTNIQGREHVRVEGWTLLGSMLGVFPVCEWTRPLPDGGWEARVEARTMTGAVVGAAEASCSRSENTWKNRDDYALRSMAQTRATSKALRQPLGFVMQLAGFDPTPAEEMPRESAPVERQEQAGTGVKVPGTWAKVTEMVSAWDEHVHDTFGQFVAALCKYEYGVESPKEVQGRAEKAWVLQKAAGAAVALREEFEPSQFPPPSTDDIRRAFASVLEGVELAIPDEVLDAEAVEAAERED